MALILADRVKESTTTTGTSDFALGGAVTGFQTFAAAVGANNTTYYAIAFGADFEVGLGTLSGDGLTLARTTVLQSSNSDTKVSFAAGSKEVFVTYPADKAVFEDASGNVSLPLNLTVAGGSTTDSLQLDLSAAITPAVGQIAWDSGQGTASLGLLGGNIISRLGQSLVAYVTNAESVTITKGQAVYLFSAQGDRATVKLAYNTGDATSAKTLGIVGEDIIANGTGFVVCQGVAYGLNLSAFTAGDTLYLGSTAGSITATKPYAPNHLVYIGIVEKANAGAGQLYVRVQNGYELDELHNVSAQSPTTGQTIVYNASTGLWEKNTVSLTVGVNGTLPVANGGTGITSFGSGVATFLGTPSSANLASAVTDETGSGALVFANSPTLVTPALGTPSALVGTNITGTASGLTAGNVTTNANLTGAVTSVGNATSLGSFTSAQLLGALTDETGTGSAVFATSPTLVTPILGTPTSATLTNATGLPISTGVSGLGTGIATALAVNTGSAGAPVLFNGALGTPTSGTVTNLTGTASININGTVGATTANTGAFTSLTASTTLGVTGVSTLTGGAVVEGLTVGRGAGAVATNTAVGASALAANTTGTLNVAVGYEALLNNTTSGWNTAVGNGALRTNSTGAKNTAVGRRALYSNTTGTDNAGFGTEDTGGGYGPLWSNTTGSFNTALGNGALGKATTASNNTAVGYQAGYSNTTGTVTAVGYQSLYSSVTANRNTGLGYRTLYATTGDDNVAIGYAAGTSNTTGQSNVFIGGFDTGVNFSTGNSNTTGSTNTAIGAAALGKNTTASQNTAIGYQASYSGTTGANNTSLGYLAGLTNITGSRNTFLGDQAGKVSTGDNNTFVGARAGFASTGVNNAFFGAYNDSVGGSGYNMTTGSKNTIIGSYTGNNDGLDIRTASNYAVISDGDGNRLLSTANGQTLALDSAVPNSGTGITFPATQAASTDANTLDDYEEGTWTPSVGGTATYSSRTGTYTKIGRQVTAWFDVSILLVGTGSGALQGLPFTNTSSLPGAGAVGYFATLVSSFVIVNPIVPGSGTSITFETATAAATTTGDNQNIWTNSSRCTGFVTYHV